MEIKRMETASLQEAVWLKEEDVLVKHLPDYYAAKKGEGFSSHVPEDDLYSVGVIVAGGLNKKAAIGHIIFYMKNATTRLTLKKQGQLELVNFQHQGHIILANEYVEEYRKSVNN